MIDSSFDNLLGNNFYMGNSLFFYFLLFIYFNKHIRCFSCLKIDHALFIILKFMFEIYRSYYFQTH